MQIGPAAAEEALSEAKRRASLLQPLLSAQRCSRSLVQAAAQELGISVRQVYACVHRLRMANGDASVLIRRRPAGGRGKSRLAPGTEELVSGAIADAFALVKPALFEQTIRDIQELCRQKGVEPPSRSTLRRRIAAKNAASTSSQVKPDMLPSLPVAMLRSGPGALSNMEHLLGCLYETITDDGGWAPFLNALARDYAGGMATLYMHDLQTRQEHALAGGLFADEKLTTYNQYYGGINPWRGNVGQRPTGVALPAEFLLPEAALVKREFFGDWLRPQGLASGVSATVQRDGARLMAVSVLFPAETRERDHEAVTRLGRLVPHLLRVAQLKRQLIGLENRASNAEAVLHCLEIGVALVDRQHQIIFLNEAAEQIIMAKDGISVLRSTLRVAVHQEQHLLKAMLSTAAAATMPDTTPGGAMRVSRLSGRMAYEILISPLARDALGPELSHAAAIVFLRDPERSPNASVHRLRQFYSLTESEARVMTGILDGKTLAEMAEQFGKRLETIRSQLKAVLHKTGENRQIDLVRRGWHGLISMSR